MSFNPTASFTDFTNYQNGRTLPCDNNVLGQTGSFSGSFAGDGSRLTDVPWENIIFSSSVISGSQFTGSFTGSFYGDGSNVRDIQWEYINFSSSVISSSQMTASFSGSFEGDGSGITDIQWEYIDNIPSGIVSSSTQIEDLGFITSSVFDGTGTNIISSSTQITSFGFISESFDVSGTNIISSSTQITSFGFISESFDVSGTNIVSSSTQIEDLGFTTNSGSFSGSFEGDGSGLTGIVAGVWTDSAIQSNTQGLTNSLTPIDSTDLHIDLNANTTYLIVYYLALDDDENSGGSFAGAQHILKYTGTNNVFQRTSFTLSSNKYQYGLAGGEATNQDYVLDVPNGTVWQGTGYIETISTGSLKVQFAQISPNASDTAYLRSGSLMLIKEV